MDEATYGVLPATIAMRELRVVVPSGVPHPRGAGGDDLGDAKVFTKEELAGLYRARWHAELDLRSIKQTMQMDVLRCKTPAMVRKEIWGHLLVYNLIRAAMAQPLYGRGGCHAK